MPRFPIHLPDIHTPEVQSANIHWPARKACWVV